MNNYTMDKITECLSYARHFQEFGPDFSAQLYVTRARTLYVENGIELSRSDFEEYLKTNVEISKLEMDVL